MSGGTPKQGLHIYRQPCRRRPFATALDPGVGVGGLRRKHRLLEDRQCIAVASSSCMHSRQ